MSRDPDEGIEMSGDARERILDRIREANREREPVPHPGSLPETIEPPWTSRDAGGADPVDAFENRLRDAGGEVVRLADEEAARLFRASGLDEVIPVALGGGGVAGAHQVFGRIGKTDSPDQRPATIRVRKTHATTTILHEHLKSF